MRIVVALIAAASLLSSVANGADLPVKSAAPVTAVPYNWTGFYAGIVGGWGWGTSHHGTLGVDFSGPFDVDGALIGGTVGYNHQLGSVVIGAEADAAWAGLKGSTAGVGPVFCPAGPPFANCTTKLRGVETVRGRLGYATDRVMGYLTGGVAFGQIYAATDPGDLNSGTETRVAGVFGGGLEAALMSRWSAKAEYLYMNFGTTRAMFIRQPGAFPINVDLETHMVRLGLNYRFN